MFLEETLSMDIRGYPYMDIHKWISMYGYQYPTRSRAAYPPPRLAVNLFVFCCFDFLFFDVETLVFGTLKWNEKSMKNGPKINQKSIKNGPTIDQKSSKIEVWRAPGQVWRRLGPSWAI